VACPVKSSCGQCLSGCGDFDNVKQEPAASRAASLSPAQTAHLTKPISFPLTSGPCFPSHWRMICSFLRPHCTAAAAKNASPFTVTS
jgi:hypothetical protein